MLVKMSDFEDANGRLDWKAYKAAQIEAGEVCKTCGAYTYGEFMGALVSGKTQGPRECSQCKHAANDTGELTHAHRVRCPHCRHLMDVNDLGVWEDGDHDLFCHECNERFTVTTHLSFSFESPALIEKAETA